MPTSFEINVYRNRTAEFSVSLYQANGTTPVAIAVEDVVRVKVGRGNGEDPDLDLSSIDPTSNGSSVVVASMGDVDSPAVVNIKFAQADTRSLSPGAYEMEILVVDASEELADDDEETSEESEDEQIAIIHAQSGVLQLIGQMGGSISVD